MAKKEKKQPTDTVAAPKKRSLISVIAGPMLLALVFMPTTLLLFVMMLPTAIVGIVDKDQPRALTVTIGATNLAGAVSIWFELLRRGHTIQAAQDLSTNIDSLITAYGAAMVGLMVYAIVVPTVAKITSHAAEYEKNKIQKQQNKMLETWGPDVLPDDNTGPKNN